MSFATLWENAEWFDDWFAVERLDEQTTAIGERRRWQFPVSYLIQGEDRAVLFDSGSGRRDILPVVEALTDLPVTATFSHPHFDHVESHRGFDRVAMFDHPTLRNRVRDGRFTPSLGQHLKLGRPTFRVDQWWAVGDVIDLGRRELEALHVPGHSPESMALLDRERGQLFLGDFTISSCMSTIQASTLPQAERSCRKWEALRHSTVGMVCRGCPMPGWSN